MDNVADDMKAKLKFVEEVDEEVSLTPEMMRTAVWLRNRYPVSYTHLEEKKILEKV